MQIKLAFLVNFKSFGVLEIHEQHIFFPAQKYPRKHYFPPVFPRLHPRLALLLLLPVACSIDHQPLISLLRRFCRLLHRLPPSFVIPWPSLVSIECKNLLPADWVIAELPLPLLNQEPDKGFSNEEEKVKSNMQKKIVSFFKPSSEDKSQIPTTPLDDLAHDKLWPEKQSRISIKYTRKAPISDHCTTLGDELEVTGGEEIDKPRSRDVQSNAKFDSGKFHSKKRSYAQFHLELGQSDFLLHTCSTCGIKYAKGDDVDEKVHDTFHKSYTHGIQFMGWRHERVIQMPLLQGERIILVLNNDSPAQRKKVQEVVNMMEIELGDGWIFHDLCKVYLFISSRRVVGCLVAEEINKAYKLITESVNHTSGINSTNLTSKSTVLSFGGVRFLREVGKRPSSMRNRTEENSLSPIICDDKPMPASCGIRALWVSPSNRRKHIATYLLDAVRQSFCDGTTLDCSQIAFSQPTPAGKALASKYTRTNSFLVYKTS